MRGLQCQAEVRQRKEAGHLETRNGSCYSGGRDSPVKSSANLQQNENSSGVEVTGNWNQKSTSEDSVWAKSTYLRLSKVRTNSRSQLA